ncbi:MAG: TIGR03960 family B12-binding radical SAM protein [Clostridiales bacterium]|jgi:radical SAM family uncharacterized protein|nr:TIGR03960 family B12-binding radical SAM protein [Clostridiales bacterium]
MYDDKILLQAQKPARYIGNEINMVRKDLANVDIRFAFAFPDVYEVGMSHNGLQILYALFNRRKDVFCERVFAPWVDMEAIMREQGLPLKSLETYSELTDFDFIGFTLQYEMTYTNILNILDLAGIPLRAAERNDSHPIICAGGPCAVNPEPLADFFDFFFIGEAEEKFDEVFDLYKAHKGGKPAFLEKLAALDGIYVPAFYDVAYHENGTIAAFTPNNPAAPATVQKVFVKDMNTAFYPEKMLVPLMETVHNRVALEIFRGCVRGCRFCQAGFIYRPYRMKNVDILYSQGKQLLESSGHDEISLLSLATNDYPHLAALVDRLNDSFADSHVSISLPSLRIDAANRAVLEKIQKVRKSSLTFAPEGGSQKMRDIIKKNISEREIFEGARLAFEGGWDRLKLYFIVGLPGEEEGDLEAIGKLAADLVEIYYSLPPEKRRRPPGITVSTSCFVPKPFTPFQWFPQKSAADFMERQQIVKKSIRSKRISYKYHDADLSVLEGTLSRGDRRIGALIERAWRLGARFDGWSEHFSREIWRQAFEDTGLSMDFYNFRQREYDEILPWDFIDIGVSKAFLREEDENARP